MGLTGRAEPLAWPHRWRATEVLQTRAMGFVKRVRISDVEIAASTFDGRDRVHEAYVQVIAEITDDMRAAFGDWRQMFRNGEGYRD
jgi:hypothetical protein